MRDELAVAAEAPLDLEKHESVCHPARLVGQTSPDITARLGCFSTRRQRASAERRLRTAIADERLVLSGKTIDCIPARGSDDGSVLPRTAWLCRKARRRGAVDAPPRLGVVLQQADRLFGLIDYRATLLRPSTSCTEVDLDSPTPSAPVRRLVCYTARPDVGRLQLGYDFVWTLFDDAVRFAVLGVSSVCMQATELP